jgi:HK97 family phage prohead protease
MNMIERRNFDGDQIETRTETAENGKRYIMGYFALNNSDSVKITERINGQLVTFTERIKPDAFAEADLSEVIYNVEHNPSRPIARTGANLTLSFTERGLFGKAEIPNEAEATTEQNDLFKNVQQKIIRGNSFAFKVASDEWYKQDGELYRNITKVSKVVDVTSTLMPAYSDTFIFTRSLDETAVKEVNNTEEEKGNVMAGFDKEVIDVDFQFSLLKHRQI